MTKTGWIKRQKTSLVRKKLNTMLKINPKLEKKQADYNTEHRETIRKKQADYDAEHREPIRKRQAEYDACLG